MIDQLHQEGFVLIPGVFPPTQVQHLRSSLEQALTLGQSADPAIRGSEGTVYAARNILHLCPEAARLGLTPPLGPLMQSILGPRMGLVRGLYFDKPPGNSWALPWHKDLTIAVRSHKQPSPHFRKPTCKAGVPHVEASETVLQSMLTARIHLDDVTDENGPVKVIPGSHRTGKALRLEEGTVVTLHAQAGDVLLIRPLVAHCSNHSRANTFRHRRILHLEFASSAELPDGYAWHDFLAGSELG